MIERPILTTIKEFKRENKQQNQIKTTSNAYDHN